MTVQETFEIMVKNFRPAKAVGMHKTLQWNITSDGTSKQWAISIHEQTCELFQGGVEKPDIVFHINEKDWLAIQSGKLEQTIAFMTGKVRIIGDMGLAMKIPGLFPEQR